MFAMQFTVDKRTSDVKGARLEYVVGSKIQKVYRIAASSNKAVWCFQYREIIYAPHESQSKAISSPATAGK